MTPEMLKSFRDRIDALDDELIALLAERSSIVQEVGRNKHKVGAAVFRPEREVAIIERMCAANQDLKDPCQTCRLQPSGLRSSPAAERSSARCASPTWARQAPTVSRQSAFCLAIG